MKPSFLKTGIFSICLFAVIALHAQNTSIGHVHGTYKDTITTYTESPEKHAHTETTVIDKDKKPESYKATNTQNNVAPGQVNPAPVAPVDNITTTEQTVTDNKTATNGFETMQSDNNCSCTSLHMAYGVGAVSILGLLLFLFLYLNEKNKKKENQ